MSWDEPLSINGHLKRYTLSYKSLPNGQVYTKFINVDDKDVDISNLSPKDAYEFRVAAVTGAGTGEYAVVHFNFSKGNWLKVHVYCKTVK